MQEEESKHKTDGLISKHKDQIIHDYNRSHGGREVKKAFFKYQLLG